MFVLGTIKFVLNMLPTQKNGAESGLVYIL